MENRSNSPQNNNANNSVNNNANNNGNNGNGIKMKLFTNMMLIITNSCNLRCSYCYEQNHEYSCSKNMSLETAKKAVDLFFKQLSPNVNRTSISFFGGEPHMAFDLMKEVINYSYNHRTIGGYTGDQFNYVVNTNGVILTDEMFSLYSKLGKKINIRVSVDGYRDNHDLTRKTADGRGSWSMLEKNLLKFKELKERYGVNVNLVNTINKSNCKDIYYNYTNIYELTKMNIGTLYVHEEDWKDEDFQTIKTQIGNLHDYCVNRKMRFSLCNVRGRNNGGNNLNEPICNAGIGTMTVTHDGNIYPCHRCYFNDMGEMYRMGNVYNGISMTKRAFIYDVNNMNMLPEKCRKCNNIIREKCHVCIPTNKKVYGDPHSVPNKFCMFQKELYYMLLEKEQQASKRMMPKEDVFE